MASTRTLEHRSRRKKELQSHLAKVNCERCELSRVTTTTAKKRNDINIGYRSQFDEEREKVEMESWKQVRIRLH